MTRELDRRFSGGIDVRLMWDSEDGRLFVAVGDRKTGQVFELDVPDRARALDVFHHPYAYAGSASADGAKPGASLAA